MAHYVLAFGGTLFAMVGAGITYLEAAENWAGRPENVTTITHTESASATPESLPILARVPSPTPSKDMITELEDKVTELVNIERAGKCEPLRTDERLRNAARAHSSDMAANNFFSHSGLNGSSFVERLQKAGYPRADAAAENIAVGYATARAVVAGWMGSAGHKANILNCSHKMVGVGLAYRGDTPYWTQDFGRS